MGFPYNVYPEYGDEVNLLNIFFSMGKKYTPFHQESRVLILSVQKESNENFECFSALSAISTMQ